MAPYRRRQFIVAVPFQARFVAFRITLLVILTLFLWILVFYPLQVEMIADLVAATRGLPGSGMPVPSSRVLIGMAAVFVLMGAMAIFESHRIVGPIFRFEKTMKALIAGDFPQRVRLRKGDNFTHLEPVINELAARFEAAARVAQRIRESLGPGLDELAALCAQHGAPEQVRTRAEALRLQARDILGGSA